MSGDFMGTPGSEQGKLAIASTCYPPRVSWYEKEGTRRVAVESNQQSSDVCVEFMQH